MHVAKKIPRIINTIASIWGEQMLKYLSSDTICSLKLTVFLELRSRQIVCFSEEIMSADKINREVKHDVYGRRQTAKITFDFLFFSCNP